jgi:hypothetical protein
MIDVGSLAFKRPDENQRENPMANDGFKIPPRIKRKLIGAAVVLVLAVFSAFRPDSGTETDQTRDDQATTVETIAREASTGSEADSAAVNAPPGNRDDSNAGILRDIGNKVKVSAAGLKYGPGSQEGHRLKHVLRHDNDLPDRPGKHGVFDGDQDEMLKVIDEAWSLVKSNATAVRTSHEGSRDIHDVDLKRRIGFVGGQVGNERGKPAASHVRLIVEGDSIISAYPY